MAPEIEWFMTLREIQTLLDETFDIPALGINLGPIERGHWYRVAYKGGSEPGVINLSALLLAGDGTRHCVAATWNHGRDLDSELLVRPFLAIVRLVKRNGGNVR